MKNIPALIVAIALIMSLGFGLSSCKDDEPPAKPKLSFADTEIATDEDGGVLEVELVLDKPHSKDLRIEYELGGTASDQDVVGSANADYEVVGDHGVVEIPAGETTGVIELDIYADAGFEQDETIEISILDTNTDEIELTADDETVITVMNDDDQLTASFGATTMTVNESDGTAGLLQIAVQLDNPASQNVTVAYTLAGTAVDSLTAHEDEQLLADYYVNAEPDDVGTLVIPAGQSTANIELRLFTDFEFEEDETIEITLAATTDVQVGTNNKITITVEQQNGKLIALIWDDPAYTDVDMDLVLWAGQSVDQLGVLSLSANAGTTPKLEVVFIPSEVTDGTFGLSHNYYSGSADPLTFEVHFADYADGVVEAEGTREIYSATYTAANKFPWFDNEEWPQVVQTFKIVEGTYTDISQITVPASGSRLKTNRVPKGIKRHRGQPSRSL
jgi:hypothetical protein